MHRHSRRIAMSGLHILPVLFLLSSCFVQGGMTQAADRQQAPIRTIKVVMDNNYPPYSFLGGEGVLQGIVVDQWRLWQRKTGIRAELTGLEWAEAQRRMAAGEFDVIDTIFRNEKREKLYDFTRPYADIAVPLFFHADISGISGPEDAVGFMVAAKAGGNVLDVLRRHGITDIVEYPSYEKIVEAARDGRVKVFTVDRPPALYYLHKMGILHRFRETPPLYNGEFHRAVKKGNLSLLAEVQKGFDLISEQEQRQIDRKWRGLPLLGPEWTRTLLLGAALVCLLVLCLFFWNYGLRKAVARRTRELKISEEGLRQSESRMRAVTNAAMDAIVMVDHRGMISYWNPAAESIFGYASEEVLHRDLHQLIADQRDRAAHRENLVHFSRTGQGNAVGRMLELRARHKNGHEIVIELSLSAIRVKDEWHAVGIARDITERKQLENERKKLQEQLVQSQKMEAIGTLAGGVAHDFNNMLGVILGYTEMALARTATADPLRDCLQRVYDAARRSADITRQLLAFARKQTVMPKVLDLNKTVEGLLGMLERLIGEDVELLWQPGAAVWPVLMDSSQIDQILVNLCINARDAMAGGGRIIIRTGNVVRDEGDGSRQAGLVPGEYVLLSVSDNGCGMDQETLSHLFEPFFTTKAMGRGTGLGLATLYGIVKQNKGMVAVSSEPGQGTTFTMHFPRYRSGHEEGERAEEERAMATAHGSETILLVEDEPSVLQLTKEMLALLGYTVLPAATPAEAIYLAREHEGTIHLLLSDVIMPEMNGRDLATHLSAFHPRMVWLFMSGYPADVIAHRGVLDTHVHFIQKPFTAGMLAAKVRAVLDGADSAANLGKT